MRRGTERIFSDGISGRLLSFFFGFFVNNIHDKAVRGVVPKYRFPRDVWEERCNAAVRKIPKYFYRKYKFTQPKSVYFKLARKYGVFIFGLFIMATGIALSIRADMGITPISSLPYVVSLGVPLTVGMLTILLHAGFLVIEFLLMPREFAALQLLQLGAAVVFGVFIDLVSLGLVWLVPVSYPEQLLIVVLSCVLLGIGICFEVAPNVLMMASEGMITAAVRRFHVEFGTVKIVLDVSLVVLSIVLSLAMFSTVHGIREGTVIAAVLVGICVKLCKLPVYAVARRMIG